MCRYAGYVMLFHWRGVEENTTRPHAWNALESAVIGVNGAKANGLSLS
jgi:hypothetical protein